MMFASFWGRAEWPVRQRCGQPVLYLDRVRSVAGRSGFSVQTLSVLAALCEEPSQWRHGYALAGQTGLKSGTLYPILIRLADRGLVEACWEDRQPAGRPRRHLYRLTAEGLASATVALAAAARPALPARRSGVRVRDGRGVAAPGVP
jgi:PadR family transcriptional regulator PadR